MSIITDKVAQCPTCHQAKHLLNMLSGSRRCEAINEMINNHDNYQLDGGILKKKSGDEWLPLGKVTGANCGELKSFWIDFWGATSFYLKNDGTLWCTGYNDVGQLGLGNTDEIHEYTQVPITDVKEVFPLGFLTIILKNDNTLWSTGTNVNGQLGVGDTTDRNEFTEVIMPNELHITSDSKIEFMPIVDGLMFVHNNSETYATGVNVGMHGNGVDTDSTVFEKSLFTNIKKVYYSYALAARGMCVYIATNDGKLMVCGQNSHGELGLGNTDDVLTPTEVTYFSNTNDIKKLTLGYSSTYILKNDGTLHACGQNNYGQLGVGDTNDRHVFTQVLDNVKTLYVTMLSVYVIKNDGTLWVTGANIIGQLGLGDNDDRNIFTNTGFTDIKSIRGGNFDLSPNVSYILKNNGKVYSTGLNNNGQLGLGDEDNRNVYTEVTLPTPIDFFTLNSFPMYVSTDGDFYITGSATLNGSHTFTPGVGSDIAVNVFTKMTLPFKYDDIEEITFKYITYLFKLKDGRLFALDLNSIGQVGGNYQNEEDSYNVVEVPLIDKRESSSGDSYSIEIDL